MKKFLSFFAAILAAVAVSATPVALPATLDVSNVSFRSDGMPDFVLEEGDYAGTYFDMGAHDSSNDTLLYAEWDVTIEPLNYDIDVVVYNENSWRVQLYLLNQAGDTVKSLRYKGSSGQCGKYAIGSLDLKDLEAGNYKLRARAATAWSKMKLKEVIVKADYKGATVALPGELLPAYAELSANASVTNNAIAFKPSTANSEYATWNVSFAAAGSFNVAIDITATNGHNYGVALLSADGQTEIGAVSEGSQKSDTGEKELGAIAVPAAGNYVVKLTNATQWSEAVLNKITFAAPSVAEPQVLYLKPGIWFNDVNNEKFAIYAFQDGKPEYWSDYMTLAEGETDIWTGTIPAGYTNLIFVRFGQNSTTPSWSDNMWNKTNDLTIQENADMYTISGWGDGEGAPCPGVWSKYVYEGPATFYITGNAALVGEAAWSAKAVKATEDSYVFEDLPAGYYQLKVLPTGSWDVNKGFDDLTTVADGLSADDDRNICFTLDEAGDVTVTYTATVFTVEGNFHVDAAPVVTTYRVGGEGADFATLSAAAAALRATPMTSDVTLLICADIAEVGNVGLVNNTDYTLTIRPDAAVKRTISFGTVADNAGPSGHIVIGYGLAGWAATPTKNVVIDGSFDGKGQYIEIQGGTIGGVDVVYYGHVTNSVVKNCRLISPRTANTTYVVHFRTEQLAGGTNPAAANRTDNAPEGVGFENCYMQVTGVSNAQAVYFNGSLSKTAAGKPKDCFIRGCEIISNLRGIFFNGAINAVIENNTFRMPTASSGFLAHGIMGNAQKGTIIVRGNHFAELKSTNVSEGEFGICGITASGGADVWVIENNVFAGLDATASGAADKAITLRYVRCGDSCVVRHNTFYMPALTKKPSTELVAASPIAALYLAGAKAYPVENNLFVSMETVANNSLIRGALNANVKNNVYYHAGGKAAYLAGAVVKSTWDEFAEVADQGSSKWGNPIFRDAAEGDLYPAYHASLLKARLADIQKDINGVDRRESTYAGAIEGAEWGWYIAGNGGESKGDWCDKHSWWADGQYLWGDSIEYIALPAGKYEFKLTSGAWNNLLEYTNVDDASKANHVFTEGDGGNIMFFLAEETDVTISVANGQVHVEGNLVPKPTHFIAGNGHEDTEGVWCDAKNWSPDATPLYNDSIVYEELKAGMVYQFKITDGSWNNVLDITNVLDECKTNYVYNGGNNNIAFQLAEDGPVVIKVVNGAVGVYGNFIDPTAIVIENYTVVGSAAMMGSDWSVSDANNDMTEVNGVWSLVKEDVEIAAGKYWYKVVGNHSYSVYEFPGANQSNEYEFLESGVYTLTFTFIPGDEPSLTLSALKTGTGVGENVISNEPVKFIHNGQVCIRRNGMIFTVTGTRVQ